MKSIFVFLLLCIMLSFIMPSNSARNFDDENPYEIHKSPSHFNYIKSQFKNFIEHSCNAMPQCCYVTKSAYFAVGTQIRDGLKVMYLFADKYMTDKPAYPQSF